MELWVQKMYSQLSFKKEAKIIRLVKELSFEPVTMGHWMSTWTGMKLDPFLTPYATFNSNGP
jgi:hypothetical protein